MFYLWESDGVFNMNVKMIKSDVFIITNFPHHNVLTFIFLVRKRSSLRNKN